MANEEQTAMLLKGVEKWNAWRKEHPDVLIDLSGMFLGWANLFGANLRGADLSGTILRRANLRGANLSEANLTKAILRGADLRGAKLSGTLLREADLSGADLSGAILTGAEVTETQLSSAIGADVTNIARSPRLFLRTMVLIPWSKELDTESRNIRTLIWAIAWIWALVGLFVGSAFASYFVTLLSSSLTPYHDELVTAGAVIGGILIQSVGLLALLGQSAIIKRGTDALSVFTLIISALLPLGIAVYALQWFFTHLGPEHGLVGRGFIFGLIAKLFLVFAWPIIKMLLFGIPLGFFLRIIGVRRVQKLVPVEALEEQEK